MSSTPSTASAVVQAELKKLEKQVADMKLIKQGIYIYIYSCNLCLSVCLSNQNSRIPGPIYKGPLEERQECY